MNAAAGTLAWLLLCAGLCRAQESPDTLAPVEGAELEELAFAQPGEREAQSELERLSALLENPIELATASESDLLLIPGFSRALARSLLDSVAAGRPLTTPDAQRAAMPFLSAVRVEEADLSGSFSTRAEAVVRQRPGESLAVRGSRWKIVQRLGVACPAGRDGFALRLGLLTEKDPGEPRLADHASGFLWVRPAAGLEFSAGDVSVESAMGLALGAPAGRSPGSRAEWRSLAARSRATSSERGGLRGALAVYRSRRLEAALFYSNRALHARLDDSSSVSSFYQAGLFRTASEELLRSRTRERAVGTRLSFAISTSARIGLSACQSTFLHTINAASLAGSARRRFTVGAADALVKIRRLELAAEYASDGSGSAFAVSLDAHLGKDLDAHADVQAQTEGFTSVHGAQALDPEGGLNVGLALRWRPWQHARWEVLSELRRSPRQGRLTMSAHTISSRFELDPPGPLAIALQLRDRRGTELAEAADEFGRTVLSCGESRTSSARLSLQFSPGAGLCLKCTGELKAVRAPASARAERGFVFTHHLAWRPAAGIELELRASSYRTEGYASRLWLWERTLRGVLNQTLLYGSGFRTCAYVRARLGESASAEVRFSRTDSSRETQRRSVTVPEEFESSVVGAQLELRF